MRGEDRRIHHARNAASRATTVEPVGPEFAARHPSKRDPAVPTLLEDKMRRQPASLRSHIPMFAAIDFETADYGRDSACAVAVVRVEGQAIVDRAYYYIRPPRRHFVFSYLHGISWNDVVDAPTFHQLWPSLRKRLAGVQFLAAHNASFDRAVLNTCCERARLRAPSHAFQCTVRLARTVWNIYPTTLPDVCRRLRIPLRHHDAGSDAEACARIVIAATEAGLLLSSRPLPPGGRRA
jgi:DNA polymerase III subunit epsilon